ncbi:hypothetical protein YC2023_020258 [Brassica napus]
MLNRNEYDDSLLKFLSVTTSWPRHGNVKVRASNPIKLYASSPNSIVLSASLKVKLELEIHLVSWISLVVVRAVSMRFNAKSRHIKPFDTIAVEKDSPASLSMRGESFQVFNLVEKVSEEFKVFVRACYLGSYSERDGEQWKAMEIEHMFILSTQKLYVVLFWFEYIRDGRAFCSVEYRSKQMVMDEEKKLLTRQMFFHGC